MNCIFVVFILAVVLRVLLFILKGVSKGLVKKDKDKIEVDQINMFVTLYSKSVKNVNENHRGKDVLESNSIS